MDLYTEPSSVQWCCVDCLIWLANGEKPEHMSEEEINDWLDNIQRIQGDSLVTLGMRREEHSCALPGITVPERKERFEFGSWRRPFPHLFHRFFVVCDSGFITGFWRESKAEAWIDAGNVGPTMGEVGGECDCERKDFSWSACDLCGSNLGGERAAFTFWFKPEKESE